MHEYDITLKLLLQGPAEMTIRALAGGAVEQWFNVELPEIQNTRVDLLGRTLDGEFIHIELQSRNDSSMALRMAEYSLRIYRTFGKFPRQIVFYVGDEPARMTTDLGSPNLHYRYTLIDVRDLDAEGLLHSGSVGDNIVAVLAGLPDPREAIQRILAKIAGLPAPSERELALKQLLILSGLRRLAGFVDEEARNMPILDDIRDHEVLGPVFQRGLDQGRQEGELRGRQEGELRGRQEGELRGRQEGELRGRQEGELRGRQEGELRILLRLVERRFGTVPSRIEAHLARLSAAELEELSVRILDAQSIDDFVK